MIGAFQVTTRLRSPVLRFGRSRINIRRSAICCWSGARATRPPSACSSTRSDTSAAATSPRYSPATVTVFYPMTRSRYSFCGVRGRSTWINRINNLSYLSIPELPSITRLIGEDDVLHSQE